MSQSPVFRRQWLSIYAALHDSRPPRRKLMKLMVKQVATEEQPFLAGDHSFWSRPEMRWSGFHFLQSPNRAMEIIRVKVIQPVGRNRKFQPLWLAWLGQTMPLLEDLWQKYLRRFARFALVSICQTEAILDTASIEFYSGGRAME
nr:hypothetical protein [Nostoc sp. TCL240-02]